jgi:hypothetical protein
MRFVKADWDPEVHGFRVDPRPHLAELPRLRAELPSGARSFATDPGHYDIAGVVRATR